MVKYGPGETKSASVRDTGTFKQILQLIRTGNSRWKALWSRLFTISSDVGKSERSKSWCPWKHPKYDGFKECWCKRFSMQNKDWNNYWKWRVILKNVRQGYLSTKLTSSLKINIQVNESDSGPKIIAIYKCIVEYRSSS